MGRTLYSAPSTRASIASALPMTRFSGAFYAIHGGPRERLSNPSRCSGPCSGPRHVSVRWRPTTRSLTGSIFLRGRPPSIRNWAASGVRICCSSTTFIWPAGKVFGAGRRPFSTGSRGRSELSYVLKRRFRDGQITSLSCLLSTPRQFPRLLVSMSVGFLQFAAGCGASLLLMVAGSRGVKETASIAAAGIGKLLWMRRYHWRSYGLSSAASGT